MLILLKKKNHIYKQFLFCFILLFTQIGLSLYLFIPKQFLHSLYIIIYNEKYYKLQKWENKNKKLFFYQWF